MSEQESSIPASFATRLRFMELVSRSRAGRVLRCWDLNMNRLVILKVIDRMYIPEHTFARLSREARVLTRLDHPRIVKVFDLSVDDEGIAFLLENLLGLDLATALAESGPFEQERAIALVAALSEGVAELHDRGYLHRDIKAANIILEEVRGPVLIDFGIARHMDESVSLTPDGVAVGTPQYMAPEILLGHDASRQSDLYALGILLYELLAGRPPFHQGELADVLEAQINDPVPGIEGLPERVMRVLQTVLSKNPLDRHQSCEEFRRDLLGISIPQPARVTETPPPSASAPEVPSRTVRLPSAQAPTRRLSRPAGWGLAALAVALLMLPGLGRLRPVTQGNQVPRPPAAFTLLPVLDVRVRSMEGGVAVHARTTEAVRLEVRVRDQRFTGGPPLQAFSPRAGYIHNIFITGMSGGTACRVELATPEPGRVVLFEPVSLFTPDRATAARLIQSALHENLDITPFDLRPLATIVSEQNIEQLKAVVAASSSLRLRTEVVNLLEILGSSAGHPMLDGMARDIRNERGQIEPFLQHVIGAWGAIGDAPAVASLRRLAVGPGRKAWKVWSYPSRLRISLAAARTWARTDPASARPILRSLLRDVENRPVALYGLSQLPDPPPEVATEIRATLDGMPDGAVSTPIETAIRVLVRGLEPLTRQYLPRLAQRKFLENDYRFLVNEGLTTWGKIDDLDSISLSRLLPIDARGDWNRTLESQIWPTIISQMEAIGAIGYRDGHAAGSRAAASIAPYTTSRGPAVRRAALRALASLGQASARQFIEQAFERYGSPLAEFTLALARTGSTRTEKAMEALLAHPSYTDLWMASVATAALPGAVRPTWFARIRK
jgi:hypothetical protein